MTYQHFEKFDISVYIESGKNEEMAQNLYFVRYPERRQPFKDIFRRLEHNLKTYGSFTMPRSKTYIKENKENEEISVLGFVEANNQMAPPGIGSSTERNTEYSRESLQSKNIVVLDGGFATQLSCHVSQPIDGDVLWSARFLASDPEAVIDTHLDFLRAGADLIITNTYQASVDLFVKHLNLSAEESYNLIKKAAQLAHTAVARYVEEFPNAKRPLVVGSVGPYGASLHDGSEYTGSYAATTSVETMREWHIPRINALVESDVDMLAIETIPCRAEAEMLVKLLKEKYPRPTAWLSFSVSQDGKSTAYGEPFQEVARACYDLNPEQIVAVGVNCTAPRLIESLISGINDGRKNPIPLIVYPNSGESYNVEMGWINRDKCEPVETYVPKWLDLGVTWVGGCCRTYAIDVTRIRREVELWKQGQHRS